MQFDNSFKILTFYYTSQNNPTPQNPTQYHYRVSNSSNQAIDFVCCDDLCHAYGFIANDDYGNDHERTCLEFVDVCNFHPKQCVILCYSCTIVDCNCNIKVAVGVHGAWYMISTYWRFT
jgi:hypothetical protein